VVWENGGEGEVSSMREANFDNGDDDDGGEITQD